MDYKNLLKPLSFRENLRLFYELIVPNCCRIFMIAIIIYGIEYLFIKELILFSTKKVVIDLFYQITDLAQNISLVMFGAIVTGYSLFQAILKTNTLKLLAVSLDGEKSKLIKFNKYFYLLGITLIFFIGLNYFLLLFLNDVNGITDIINQKIKLDRVMALIWFRIYSFMFLVILLDMKSFLKNIYDNFMVNAYIDITE